MNELSIDPGYLRSLILKVRALMAQEETVIPDDGDNATDDPGAFALQETPGDLTREELLEEFEGLNDDQQAELVALMWIGRGDAEAESWEETVQLARDRHETETGDYLLGHPLVADYWAEGLDKLGHGSSVIEDGEY